MKQFQKCFSACMILSVGSIQGNGTTVKSSLLVIFFNVISSTAVYEKISISWTILNFHCDTISN